MRPLRLLLSLSSCLIFIIVLSFIAASKTRTVSAARDHNNRLGAYFSWNSPSSLFPPSAIISLTDDNSTFFLARPAAFGPPLPGRGLSGQIWIGAEGELGCSDVPGWSDGEHSPKSFEAILQDDKSNSLGKQSQSSNKAKKPSHADIQSLQETAEIAGKVVLLSRGGCGFLEKAKWVQRRGGVALIVGDDMRGGPLVTMYARGDTSNVTIPSIFTSHTTAHLLSKLLPKSAEQNSAVPHAGPKGGSITPGSGEYHQAGEKPINLKAPKNPEKSKAGSKKDPAPDKSKSWMGRLVGSDNIEDPKLEDAKSSRTVSQDISKPVSKTLGEHDNTGESHDGLWVTLTPASMSSSPFFDTLLVLVVSPLVTLTIVYALLLLRSRIRRRRWRAPKSIVDRFPVRIYHTVPSSNSSDAPESTATSPRAPTQTTPLLQAGARPISQTRSRPRSRTVSEVPVSTSSPANTPSLDPVQEKREAGLAEWRRRYGGRQRDCAICIDEFEDGVSRVMSLPCGHEFHVDCITPWLTTRRRTCPNCKADVVRSFSRGGGSSYSSSSAQPLLAHSHDESLDIDSVQEQAVNTRNYDPAANEPVTDLEQGSVDPDRTR
ncbi:uncharacterized protein M437DRAFT_55004 [Aureobasidium melanogenum CBS 110374]|uniref:RING-type domain-containing protein n=1 Tax=Aureobasidium melanogenum (strain CBS 110374) TaxID=1043003 RepID=A0A074WC39_AURM1|nr:uncharacterized protein M437DRAFT_55004 [Aureobasidium melanogenum CBS 110374]KEQ60066.1 hypothetical protein M437DRAFT_55004 [Aureobasidium melanogenum CBS 110374]